MEVAVIYLLNLFDLACTMFALNMGARELNPFMQSVPFMVFYKTVIVGGLLLFLYNRKEKSAMVGMKLLFVVYGLLAIYHIAGLAMSKGVIL